MKTGKWILIIMVVAIVFAFGGCESKSISSVSLNPPDKINIYADGKQKQITKSGDKYDQAIFDRVNFLVNIRIPKELATVKSETSENDIREAKGYAVEFVYDKPQRLTISNGNKKQVQFTEIILPLSERWQNIAFVKIKDNLYTPIGLNENLDYLVKASAK